MNVSTLQSRLKQSGYDPGPLDGALGPVTMSALVLYLAAPGAPRSRSVQIGAALAIAMKISDIWTPRRIQHFFAQMAHETGGFLWLEEIGGPKYFAKYDGRKDLGNTEPGDGYRFKGRGITQLTGRANYAEYGKALGIDLVGHPERAADPDVAAKVATLYWASRNINPLADGDDLNGVTRKINGGLNGLDDRRARLASIRAVWGASQ